MAGDVAALRDLAALKDVTFAFERCESRLCEMFTPDYHLVSIPPPSPPLPPSFCFSLPPCISSSGSLLLLLSRKFLSLFCLSWCISIAAVWNIQSKLPSRLSLSLFLSLVCLCSRARAVSRLLSFFYFPLSFAPFLFFVLSLARCPSCSFPLSRELSFNLSHALALSRLPTHSAVSRSLSLSTKHFKILQVIDLLSG